MREERKRKRKIFKNNTSPNHNCCLLGLLCLFLFCACFSWIVVRLCLSFFSSAFFVPVSLPFAHLLPSNALYPMVLECHLSTLLTDRVGLSRCFQGSALSDYGLLIDTLVGRTRTFIQMTCRLCFPALFLITSACSSASAAAQSC